METRGLSGWPPWAHDSSARGTLGWNLRGESDRSCFWPSCLNLGSTTTLPVKCWPLQGLYPPSLRNQNCGKKDTAGSWLCVPKEHTAFPLCCLSTQKLLPLDCLLSLFTWQTPTHSSKPTLVQLLQNSLSGPPTRRFFPLWCHTSLHPCSS